MARVMNKYYPEGDNNAGANGYGYVAARLMVKVLEMCGDELTRENVMKLPTSRRWSWIWLCRGFRSTPRLPTIGSLSRSRWRGLTANAGCFLDQKN
jgi:hypothetical protein